MKKILSFLAIAVLAITALANELTVCSDYNSVSNRAPINGLYNDQFGTMGQMIYPSDMLASMNGCTITSISFYAENGIKCNGGITQLSLKEVDLSYYETCDFITDATIVAYSEPIYGDNIITFYFDQPFTYNGGNLMVETLVIESGDYGSTYWVGVETDWPTSFYSYYNYSGEAIMDILNFLPKATFTYEGEGGDTPDPGTTDPSGTAYEFIRNSEAIIVEWGSPYTTRINSRMRAVFSVDGKVYVKNLIGEGDYDAWVEGTYDWSTKIISIPTGQFLQGNENNGIKLVWGSTYANEANGTIEFNIDQNCTTIRFKINDDQNLELLDSEGNITASGLDRYNATGMMAISSDNQSIHCIEFKTVGKIINAKPGVPASPTIYDDWMYNVEDYGMYYVPIYFTLPEYDVSGNPLVQEFLSYSIYTSHGYGYSPELVTFNSMDYRDYYSSDFSDFSGELTEIPYSVWSKGDVFTSSSALLLLHDYPNEVYIQAHYTVGSLKYSSDIVSSWDHVVTFVNEPCEAKTIESIRYYNLAGQEVTQPCGLTIQVTNYSDGTRSVTKVIK